MQMKTSSVAEASTYTKEKARSSNSTRRTPTYSHLMEKVEFLTYLVSIIDEQGGSDDDVNARIGKARSSFLQLKNIWNSKQLSVNQYQSQNFQYERQDSSTVRR
ncbi:unnamed protein product [Schistosoma margrebowiei]|uniref:Uncharacterized protein n=1 Tax=Schistosoma margrebowiei TaxID=48269 RepID=A0A183MCV6_9TREM|nr:unnamed protein product [Schistosoma margrebowiei]